MAFQLTNFLRDVVEDLDRGRVYLPAEDLDRFGADPSVVGGDPGVDRADALRDRAGSGAVRVGRSRDRMVTGPFIRLRAYGAGHLYSGILDRIEANGYDVFSTRARVSAARKLVTGLRCLAGTIGTKKP